MRQVLSLILAFAIMLSVVPTAFAAEETSPADLGESVSEGTVVEETAAPTEAPASTEAPAVTEEPAETDPPAVTEEPASTEAPAVPEEPVSNEAPGAGEEPAQAEQPGAGDVPVMTADLDEDLDTQDLAAVKEITTSTQWKYLDDGTDPAGDSTAADYVRTSWTAENFDDSAWKTGAGPFGSKKGAAALETGYTATTVLNGVDGSDDHEAYFFRTKLQIDSLEGITLLKGTAQYDDGLIIYINGTRVAAFEDIACDDAGTSQNTTISANLQYGGSNGSTPRTSEFSVTDLSMLHTGENTVAVELHQGRKASSDLWFSLELATSTEAIVTPSVQSNISLSVGKDETQMNFTWHSTTADAGKLLIAKQSELVDGAMPETAVSVTATSVVNNDSKYTNKATVTDLAAGTTYAYQLVNGDSKSDIYTFTTDDGGAFSFAFVADPQIGAGTTATDITGWGNTLNKVATESVFSDVSFMLSAGDQVNTASSESEYDGYLDHDALLNLPVATVIGNHDTGSDAYTEHFNVPNESTQYGTTTAGGDYYFVYNDVLFLVLNSNDQSEAEHKTFMKAAIDANPDVTWKIVTFHHSIFSAASHAVQTDILSRREKLVPIFEELDIDVVLMGHDHVYVRSYIMDGTTPVTDTSKYDDANYSSVTNPDGILYVTANSSSGSKYYNIQNVEFPYSAVQNQEKVPNVSKVTVSNNKFTITTYRTSDMIVVDTFTINRTSEVSSDVPTEINAETEWKYLDDGTDPAGNSADEGYNRTSWTAADFDDSEWKTGYATFGACNGSLTNSNNYNEVAKTLLEGCTGSNDHPAYFFRTEIYVAEEDLSKGLAGTIVYDDSAIVYVNGQQVFEGNIGSVTSNSSFSNANKGVASIEDFTVDASYLKAGVNTIAVAVHNSNISSWDIWFDMTLGQPMKVEAVDEIDENTVWAYWDTNTDPAGDSSATDYNKTSWTSADYDDSAWETGKASFGAYKGYRYNPNNSPADTAVTVLDGCTGSNDTPAYFFRTKLNVDSLDGINSLQGTIKYDDSVIVYVNGTNVFEGNLGSATTNTSFSSANNGAANEAKLVIPSNVLKTGENIVAVEVHNSNAGSLDIWFEMTLAPSAERIEYQSDIVMNMGADESRMNFTWYYKDNTAGKILLAKNADVQNGAMPADAAEFAAVATLASDGNYSNQTTVTGLEPGTTYAYQLVNGTDVSNIYTFTTGDEGEFSFAYVSDPQIGMSGVASNTASWTKTLGIVQDELDVSFLLTTGDQVNNASSEEHYTGLLEQDVLKSLPLATVIGNHDDDSTGRYAQHFNMANESATLGTTSSGGDSYFVYNDVLFMVINTNDKSIAEHKAFMQAAIEANADATWKIVALHHSLYSGHASSTESATWVSRSDYAPVLQELDVDVVLQGHDHIYCRTYILDGLNSIETDADYEYGNGEDKAPTAVTNPDGILYMTVNAGTNSGHFPLNNPTFTYAAVQNQENVPNVSKITVSESAFTITTYRTTDETVVDSFTIYKTAEEDKEIPTEINADTEWKYLDNNTDPAGDSPAEGYNRTSWTAADYDDSDWKTGTGSFGAKNGAIAVLDGGYTPKTLLTQYKTDGTDIESFFFRTKVYVEDASAVTKLVGTLIHDDSATLYINGTKVAGWGDDGVTANLQYATNGHQNAPAVETICITDAQVLKLLVDGENTIAVEIHQDRKNSSDVYFDMNLSVSTLNVVTEIDENTDWKYLDDNTDPAGDSTAEGYNRTSWTAESFNDTAWSTGKGPFGATNDKQTYHNTTPTTKLNGSYGSSSLSDHYAYFFRTTLKIESLDDVKQLAGNIKYDDAVIIYINGTKVWDGNNVACEADGTALDREIQSNQEYGGKNLDNPNTAELHLAIEDLKDILVEGENTIAVELHQQRATSTDIYFYLELAPSSEKIVVQNDISLSMGADESKMNFTWYAPDSEPGTLLVAKYDELVDGAMPANAPRFEATATEANDGNYSNQVTAINLEPGTKYAYQMINGAYSSDIYTFTTGNSGAFSFAYVGDPQIGASGNATSDGSGWDNTLNIVAENEIFSDISFMLSAGDQVNTASSEDQYDLYLDHDALLSLPVATVIGNHDSGSDAYNEHFNLANESATLGITDAGGDSWFVYNNVLFMVLNSNDRSAAEHKAFMEAAIAANPDVSWKIVTFHHSLYTVANHSEDADILSRREQLVPIFTELDIDVVLMGHDHVYCRSYMMNGLTPMTDASIYDDANYSSITNPTGILYVTANSGSGSKMYNIKSVTYDYAAVSNQEKVPNVSKVSVSDEQFTITTYRTSDMTVVDTFTINRTNPAWDVEDLIEKIGEVTLESEEAINKARDAYDALTDEQKAEVDNIEKLHDAEHDLAILKAQAAQAAAEDARKAAEEAQIKAEQAQEKAEKAQQDAETAAEQAAKDKTAAEDAANIAKEAAEQAQAAKEAAEAAKTAAETAKAAAETAAKAAEEFNLKAAAEATKAAQEAAKSAQSASDAADSASAAASSAASAAEACKNAQVAQAEAEKAAAAAEADRKAAEEAKKAAEEAAAKAQLALDKYNALVELEDYTSAIEITSGAQAEAIAEALENGRDSINAAEISENVPTALEAAKAAVDEAAKTAADVNVYRVYGETRYETSFAIADVLKEELGVEKFDTVIVACGTNFADAMSGSYLAAMKNAPILLTDGSAANMTAVKNYIKSNLNANGTVYLLGGTGVVPAAMESGLGGFNVKRLAGPDRYETNLAILKEAGTNGKSILVCSGVEFADSLSASATGLPILLVGEKLTSEQKAFLAGKNSKFVIIGGEGAVNKTVAAELAAYGTTERVGGATRYETSVMVAERFFKNPDAAVLAYAKNFPDGLCGGSLAYAMGAPVILTANLRSDVATEYAGGNIKSGIVLGGSGLINDATVKTIFAMSERDSITVK